MSRKKKGGRLKGLIIVLAVALLAVAAMIAWKQWEYSTSEAFYDGLRGVWQRGGARA